MKPILSSFIFAAMLLTAVSSQAADLTLEVSELVINEFMAANDGGMSNNANGCSAASCYT